MPTVHLVPPDIRDRYHAKEWRNATGVLSTACPVEWRKVQEVLRGFRVLKSEVVGGGNRSLVSQRIDRAFYARGWREKGFATSIIVDDTQVDSPTHAVDCLKGGGGGCPVLTFAIWPVNYEDDGPEALTVLQERIAGETRGMRRRASLPDQDDG